MVCLLETGEHYAGSFCAKRLSPCTDPFLTLVFQPQELWTQNISVALGRQLAPSFDQTSILAFLSLNPRFAEILEQASDVLMEFRANATVDEWVAKTGRFGKRAS